MNEKSTTSAWFWCLFLSTQYHGAFAKLLVAIFCHWWTYWMKSKPCWTGLSEFLGSTSTLERPEFCSWCAPYPSLVQKSCCETVAVFDVTKMLESTSVRTKTCFQHPQSKPLLTWMGQHLFSDKNKQNITMTFQTLCVSLHKPVWGNFLRSFWRSAE